MPCGYVHSDRPAIRINPFIGLSAIDLHDGGQRHFQLLLPHVDSVDSPLPLGLSGRPDNLLGVAKPNNLQSGCRCNDIGAHAARHLDLSSVLLSWLRQFLFQVFDGALLGYQHFDERIIIYIHCVWYVERHRSWAHALHKVIHRFPIRTQRIGRWCRNSTGRRFRSGGPNIERGCGGCCSSWPPERNTIALGVRRVSVQLESRQCESEYCESKCGSHRSHSAFLGGPENTRWVQRYES